ncbi:CheR family methyltransferase [Thermosediminibacter litoriperuensis]|uniref:protein-glutamate O-methyltransferase n=1 Tax=Thermosediminibacter litoriperuensis TaxID=291989 RepID=A0A5S5AWW9_9FIRM|nr:protein-glutamate O-methyltransferase CheR [Thermosediminibacter litoriperuensis]TYP56133.1 chemotaxis protein methyltransferase CheR [Thermosediminibacter litoriperuensis]
MKNIILDNKSLRKLTDLIYRTTGLRYDFNKKYYLERRIRERMEVLEIEDIKSFLRILQFDAFERQQFINALTVKETYFFREYEQLKLFAEKVIPMMLQEGPTGLDKTIKVLSAGCATGEEAYTLGIIMNEMLEGEAFDWRVVGIDIDTLALEKAKKGTYDTRSIRLIPKEYLNRYLWVDGEFYKVKPFLKQKINFAWANLLTGVPEDLAPFEVVFCRNVLIYFDDVSRERVLKNLYKVLVPGGYIFFGHADFMGKFSTIFRPERIGGHLVYRK